jgi:hypothetical protein
MTAPVSAIPDDVEALEATLIAERAAHAAEVAKYPAGPDLRPAGRPARSLDARRLGRAGGVPAASGARPTAG